VSRARACIRWLVRLYRDEIPRIVWSHRRILTIVVVLHLLGWAFGYHRGANITFDEAFALLSPEPQSGWVGRLLGFSGQSVFAHGWLRYFSHNTLSAVLNSIIGFCTFGTYVLVIILKGGYSVGLTVGAVMGMARAASRGGPLAASVGVLLPHGVLEVPVLLLAWGLGLRGGLAWIRPLPGMRRWASVKFVGSELARALALVIPVLLVAALLETYANPVFFNRCILGVGAYPKVESERVVGPRFTVARFAWSQEGKRIAIVTPGGALLVASRRGREVADGTLLLKAGRFDGLWTPCWSSDGEEVFVPSVRRVVGDDWENEILAVDVQSGKAKALPAIPHAWHLGCVLSPDGRYLAAVVSRREPNGRRSYNLWVFDTEARSWRQVTGFAHPEGITLSSGLAWSSDSARIAFIGRVTGAGSPAEKQGNEREQRHTGRLCVVGLHGGPVQVLAETCSNSSIAWSPDGEWIACQGPLANGPQSDLSDRLSDSFTLTDLLCIRADGTSQVDAVARVDYFSSLAWSPDGRELFYSRLDTLMAGTPRLWDGVRDGGGEEDMTGL